jgi:hypothetical protein
MESSKKSSSSAAAPSSSNSTPARRARREGGRGASLAVDASSPPPPLLVDGSGSEAGGLGREGGGIGNASIGGSTNARLPLSLAHGSLACRLPTRSAWRAGRGRGPGFLFWLCFFSVGHRRSLSVKTKPSPRPPPLPPPPHAVQRDRPRRRRLLRRPGFAAHGEGRRAEQCGRSLPPFPPSPRPSRHSGRERERERGASYDDHPPPSFSIHRSSACPPSPSSRSSLPRCAPPCAACQAPGPTC